VTFAPRIKDPSAQNLISFGKIKTELTSKGYPITPAYYVNESLFQLQNESKGSVKLKTT